MPMYLPSAMLVTPDAPAEEPAAETNIELEIQCELYYTIEIQ